MHSISGTDLTREITRKSPAANSSALLGSTGRGTQCGPPIFNRELTVPRSMPGTVSCPLSDRPVLNSQTNCRRYPGVTQKLGGKVPLTFNAHNALKNQGDCNRYDMKFFEYRAATAAVTLFYICYLLETVFAREFLHVIRHYGNYIILLLFLKKRRPRKLSCL